MNEPKDRELARKTTSILTNAAAEKWKTAPVHIKTMAGPYVGPMLAAILAINDELSAIKNTP